MFIKKRVHKLISRLRIIILRLQGIDVSWDCHVSWTAEIKRMGGHVTIGAGSFIDRGAIIRASGGDITIGRKSSINPYCILYGHGGLNIGDYVRVAAHSIFIPANHIFSDLETPIYQQGESMLGICVEDDVWIAAGVRVLDGVKIGRGSVIAAGSVVTSNLPPFGVYGGIPAKKLKDR